MSSLSIGLRCEKAAADYLSTKNYNIVTQNYRCPYGEIDIIATHNGVLVFIEVKARTSAIYGTPLDAVTNSKLNKISLTAEHFIQHTKLRLPARSRIDVVAVDIINNQPAKITIYSGINLYQ